MKQTPKDFLTPDEFEDFEERRAIMEFCGGLPKLTAEVLALKLIIKNRQNENTRHVDI